MGVACSCYKTKRFTAKYPAIPHSKIDSVTTGSVPDFPPYFHTALFAAPHTASCRHSPGNSRIDVANHAVVIAAIQLSSQADLPCLSDGDIWLSVC